MQFKNIKLLFSTILIIIITSSLQAQSSFSLSAGGDIVSRYIWRGLEINGTLNIQPTVEATYGGLTAGLWGSYAFAERGSTDELDFYAGYTISTESAVTYSGPSSIPISIFLGYTFKPASVKSLYWEVGYSTSIDAFGFDIFVGGTDGGAAEYYGSTEFAVITTGFKASQDITLGESLQMPLSVSFILNPKQETVYLVFGVGLKI